MRLTEGNSDGKEGNKISILDERRRSDAEGHGAREDKNQRDRSQAQALGDRNAAESSLARSETSGSASAEEESIVLPAQPELIVGKYFIATFPHWDGRVEAMIDDGHYLVRFEVGSDGSPACYYSSYVQRWQEAFTRGDFCTQSPYYRGSQDRRVSEEARRHWRHRAPSAK
jgi:hypothetical protein